MSAKKDFIRRLLNALWENYAGRVSYARTYQGMLLEMNGVFINDHIAFRGLGLSANGQDLGLMATANIFASLGFEERDVIDFPAQKLVARYFQHEEPDFPKIFCSELRVEELHEPLPELIQNAVQDARLALSADDLATLRALDNAPEPPDLFEKVLRHFFTLPWSPPLEETLYAVNEESQYGAWVLVHGYAANHFTGYVNRHGVDAIDDIEKVIDELKRRGVPMKDEIEGARGSKLRQTSTEAVREPVRVRRTDGTEAEIEWTYAYMEFAQRGEVEENGAKRLFQGFLGPQTGQLAEMTRLQ